MPRDSLDTMYRLIASGRAFEAIHLINKVLKKQPDFIIAKVWKCEALYCMGQITESEELLASIMEQAPTDKPTLDSIADFYRARGNYVKLVEVYEYALKCDPNDESWRKALFECCGLAGDYKKQQQQALLLYKQSSRMLFYCMAVVCLLQQVEENPVALSLAERMMIKQQEAGKIRSRNEILLLINVLEKRGKHEEALALLEKSATDLDTLISSSDKKIELLIVLKRWSTVVAYLKQLIKEKPDNWAYYKQYLAGVLQLQFAGGAADDPSVDDSPERARQFLSSLCEEHNQLRGPFLAAIELTKLTTTGEESDDDIDRLSDLIVDFFNRFGDKAICAFDLSLYVTLIPESKKAGLLTRLSGSGFSELDPIELQRRMSSGKHISFLQFSRMLGTQTSLTIEQRERLCLDLSRCYHEAKDCDRREQYLLLLTHERSTLFRETGDAEHLILAACELEDSLALTPVFAVQVLLLQLYFALGASKTARMIYRQLRIQSVQVDTLVHLFLASLSSTGHFTVANEMWELALKILQQCTVESLEALVWCYRAGSFHRVEEFTQCARRFQRTITVPLLRGEKSFLDLVVGDPSRAEQALAASRGRPRMVWETCLDNRDLKALPTWDPPTSQLPADQSYAELINFCKIREATISCLTLAIIYGKQRQSDDEKCFLISLDELKTLYSDVTPSMCPGRSKSATRLHQIVVMPLPSLLEKIMEPDMASIEKICNMLRQTTERCMEVITAQKVKNPRLSLETMVTQVEMLAVVTIACGAARVRLAPAQRRRSEQLVRAIVSCWTSLEGSLPVAQIVERSQESSIRREVDAQLRHNYQEATDDLRKVIRKKVTYLQKLI